MTREEEEFLQIMRESNPRFPEGQLWQFIRATNAENAVVPVTPAEGGEDLHGFEEHYRTTMHVVSMCLGRVADGDFTSIATGETYSELHQFVTGPLHAHLLGYIAFKACWNPYCFPGFVFSASLPEFFPQLFEWMRALSETSPVPERFDWRSCLKRAWEKKDDKRTHPLALDYVLQKMAMPAAKTPNDTYEAFAEISRKSHQSSKRRQSRREKGMTERGNRFKDAIIANWMSSALWCRSSAQILRIISPKSEKTDPIVSQLETELSRLGLRRPPINRRNVLERELASAEDKFFKRYGADLF